MAPTFGAINVLNCFLQLIRAAVHPLLHHHKHSFSPDKMERGIGVSVIRNIVTLIPILGQTNSYARKCQ